jgi:hypothetical protein|tara:strand:- start:240 stop:476 length:237 start_codon:yes stop_codon:yes gene_type:complete
MTLPNERFRSLQQGKKLLEELCDPGKTPRVPSLIRDRARAVLRHFPTDYDLNMVVEDCPNLFEKSNNSSRINNKQSNL